MPLINREVNLIFTWSSTCVIANYTGAGTKLYKIICSYSNFINSR